MSKKEREISEFEKGFEGFFCLRSNVNTDNIISGLVWKRVWKIIFFGHK